ncbi:MAG: type II toxin-antitoxin system HicB family antitoxin [Selenomonadaceae bacterium]|nr:type II toxin-antitoxin system HicB family antitoxin [Selenomonadaceae bacterium]MBQ7723082.1 type II toxin-antitoxin system HicB family antitoxin [Selenomonadaceae bacterium]
MKYDYPAIFTWHEQEKIYTVTFPDADNWFTDGYSLSEAMEYAADVLNLMLWDAEKFGDPIPKASKIEDIKLEDKNSFVQYVHADTELYEDWLNLLQLRKILDMKKRYKASKVKRFKKRRTEVSL